MLPYDPEPLEHLQARYTKALDTIYDVRLVAKGWQTRPGERAQMITYTPPRRRMGASSGSTCAARLPRPGQKHGSILVQRIHRPRNEARLKHFGNGGMSMISL